MTWNECQNRTILTMKIRRMNWYWQCDLINYKLRVFLSINDHTLKTYEIWTYNVRPYPIFLLKDPKPKVYDDPISNDTAPASGSDELIKIQLQMRKASASQLFFSEKRIFCVINVWSEASCLDKPTV